MGEADREWRKGIEARQVEGVTMGAIKERTLLTLSASRPRLDHRRIMYGCDVGKRQALVLHPALRNRVYVS